MFVNETDPMQAEIEESPESDIMLEEEPSRNSNNDNLRAGTFEKHSNFFPNCIDTRTRRGLHSAVEDPYSQVSSQVSAFFSQGAFNNGTQNAEVLYSQKKNIKKTMHKKDQISSASIPSNDFFVEKAEGNGARTPYKTQNNDHDTVSMNSVKSNPNINRKLGTFFSTPPASPSNPRRKLNSEYQSRLSSSPFHKRRMSSSSTISSSIFSQSFTSRAANESSLDVRSLHSVDSTMYSNIFASPAKGERQKGKKSINYSNNVPTSKKTMKDEHGTTEIRNLYENNKWLNEEEEGESSIRVGNKERTNMDIDTLERTLSNTSNTSKGSLNTTFNRSSSYSSPICLGRTTSDPTTAYSDRFIPSRCNSQIAVANSVLESSLKDSSSQTFSSPTKFSHHFNGNNIIVNSIGNNLTSLQGSPVRMNADSSNNNGAGNGNGSSGTNTNTGSSDTNNDGSNGTGQTPTSPRTPGREGQSMLNMLLKTELLGIEILPPHLHNRSGYLGLGGSGYLSGGNSSGLNTVQGAANDNNDSRSNSDGSSAHGATTIGRDGSPTKRRFIPVSPNVLQFKSSKQKHFEEMQNCFTLSPLSCNSRRLLSAPRKTKRKIAKVPFKVLDAPALQDDFYLNLVDWSSMNVLAVGLGSCVYLWSACTSKVTKLCDLGPDDIVTSVSWTQRGAHLAVGTNSGEVQIWDTCRCKKVRSMSGHSARVGTMAWNSQILASGSRDRFILIRDARVREQYITKLAGHKQEVCGLKWSFDDSQLASGGNDNKLYIWNLHANNPVCRFTDHTAAVKAIAWNPHQHGLLASGGGTADRCIRFWNTLNGTNLHSVDTGSQVCNLMWSKNINEIVSTHGYSLNQIILWRYPSMTKVTTLTGHTYRVLYLAMSPDGQTIVTGAGDETLRFWNVFPGPKSNDGNRLGSSLVFSMATEIR